MPVELLIFLATGQDDFFGIDDDDEIAGVDLLHQWRPRLQLDAARRRQRIVEHDPENFEIPPGASQRYTLIEITAFPGRSATAKRSLYEAIVRNLATAGVPAQDILVVLHEPPMENWGIRGGKPANEVDLGYRVDV